MRARGAALAVGLAALAVVGGCGETSPSTLDPEGTEARQLAGLWWVIFGFAAFVYVVVAGFIFAAALRNRAPGSTNPGGLSDTRFILIGGVAAPVVILLVMAVLTVRTSHEVTAAGDDPLRIEVEGADWFWKVRYLDQGFETANEIHIPVGRQVEFQLVSRDVIHSFWVPELAGKADLIPGQRNTLRVTAEEPGEYLGQCAEFCGLQHAHMQFRVIAQPPDAWRRWMARRTAPPSEPEDEMAARGRMVFMREACSGCHSIRGTEARGELGPDLSDLGSRRTIGAGVVPNTRGHLAGWIADSQSIKPGNLMPPVDLDPDDLGALVHYLESLSG